VAIIEVFEEWRHKHGKCIHKAAIECNERGVCTSVQLKYWLTDYVETLCHVSSVYQWKHEFSILVKTNACSLITYKQFPFPALVMWLRSCSKCTLSSNLQWWWYEMCCWANNPLQWRWRWFSVLVFYAWDDCARSYTVVLHNEHTFIVHCNSFLHFISFIQHSLDPQKWI
jgi:hypothetical protein